MSPNQLVVHRATEAPGSAAPFPADPLASALGAHLLRADRQAGRVELSYRPGQTFLQGEGVVQGGAVGAMLDFAAACAAMAVLEPGVDCATVSLTTSFLRPVMAGACVARAEVERLGKSLVFTRASLHAPDKDARILATATAVLAVVAAHKAAA